MAEKVVFKVCTVVENEDNTGQGLIKAMLLPDDAKFQKDHTRIQSCVPLLPRVFGLTPKVGEKVIVCSIDGQRYYIGPIYGQLNNLDDATGRDATASLQGSDSNPGENPEDNIDILGALPERDDVSINGKGSTGIYVKKNDIIIHSGLKVIGGKNKIFQNTSGDDAAIQVSYDKDGSIKSSITMFANRINLFGNTPGTDVFDPNKMHKKGKHVISQEDIYELINTAQSVPYGEKLCTVLLKIIEAIVNHTHPFPMKPPVNVSYIEEISKYLTKKENSGNENIGINDYYIQNSNNTTLSDEILSRNIKIN